jgi:hypothetical protein
VAQVNQQNTITRASLVDEVHGAARDVDKSRPLRLNVQDRAGDQLRLGLDDWGHPGRHGVRLKLPFSFCASDLFAS